MTKILTSEIGIKDSDGNIHQCTVSYTPAQRLDLESMTLTINGISISRPALYTSFPHLDSLAHMAATGFINKAVIVAPFYNVKIEDGQLTLVFGNMNIRYTDIIRVFDDFVEAAEILRTDYLLQE